MGYTTDTNMVRVDFFKPGGKWYTTEAVKWLYYDKDVLIHAAFRKSLAEHLKNRDSGPAGANTFRLSGMTAVCLEPYHEHAHPLMLPNWDGKEHE